MKGLLRSTEAYVTKREEYLDSTASIQKEKRMNMQQSRLHGWWRLALMPLLLLTVLILVLATRLALPRTAHAQSGNTLTFTMTIASPVQLIARTTLQISGTASCTLPAGATLLGSAGGSWGIAQASGRQIVQAGTGFIALTTCDGTTQTAQLFATPPAGSAPFHGGPATATGTFEASWIDALGNLHEDFLSTSPEAIRIGG